MHIYLPINFIRPTYYARCDATASVRERENANESEYTHAALEKAKRKQARGHERHGGRSFWQRPRRIHGRASFSKVSERTRMPAADSRMGSRRIDDRARAIARQRSRGRAPRFFPPSWDNGNREECTPRVFDYAENYRNFHRWPVSYTDCTHDVCTGCPRPIDPRNKQRVISLTTAARRTSRFECDREHFLPPPSLSFSLWPL